MHDAKDEARVLIEKTREVEGKVIERRGYCDHCGTYGPIVAVWNHGVPVEYKDLCARDEGLTKW